MFTSPSSSVLHRFNSLHHLSSFHAQPTFSVATFVSPLSLLSHKPITFLVPPLPQCRSIPRCRHESSNAHQLFSPTLSSIDGQGLDSEEKWG
ncbi:hypothetical protein M569_14227 [Genlisea aurea]|uniref:Uncharacterized protein n=1 Tax=Genlisea aurea TaxID=192259 RepID=S8DCP5_9LAMI|nr:hypothetical protein M569_14227 [Genlisea aurea]